MDFVVETVRSFVCSIGRSSVSGRPLSIVLSLAAASGATVLLLRALLCDSVLRRWPRLQLLLLLLVLTFSGALAATLGLRVLLHMPAAVAATTGTSRTPALSTATAAAPELRPPNSSSD